MKYSEFDTELLHFLKFVAGLKLSEFDMMIIEKKSNHLWKEYEKHKKQVNSIAMY